MRRLLSKSPSACRRPIRDSAKRAADIAHVSPHPSPAWQSVRTRQRGSQIDPIYIQGRLLRVPQQGAPLVENPVTALEDDCKQTMTDDDSKKGFGFFSATANVRAYQAKLLEMAQANMQFAFEFAQRLATIRSPVEFPSVIAEFTSKRIAMFRQHSKEMAELSAKR